MPSDNCLLNIHIPLPLALYVIPLAFMAEYIAQQLWGRIHQSIEAEDLLPPSSSPLPPPPSSSLGENSPISAYATPSPSPPPILLVRMMDKGNQPEEEIPSTPPDKSFVPFHCLICRSKEHGIGDCPNLTQIPAVQEAHWPCVLCWKQKHMLEDCPEYRCPICLYPAPGHRNNSCPNSPIDPDSSDEDWPDDLWVTWSGDSRAETGVMLWYWWTPILFLPRVTLKCTLRRLAWSHARSCHSQFIFSFLNLVATSFLGQNPRSRSPMFPLLVNNTTSPMLLLIAWLFSTLPLIANIGTFLVHLSIVLSLRKAPIGPVYKPAHVSLFPLASSMHHLPSNLVSTLGLPVWPKPHKLLITRSPSKKTSLDLPLDLGLINLSSTCHRPRVLIGTLCVLALHQSVHC